MTPRLLGSTPRKTIQENPWMEDKLCDGVIEHYQQWLYLKSQGYLLRHKPVRASKNPTLI
jgi:hypothetical protein